MMKLNGWQTIGVVGSVAWILGAWLYTDNSEFDRASAFIASQHVACDSGLAGRTGDDFQKGFVECNKIADESLALAISNARLDATLLALIPVPLGWGFAYLVLFLVRWVKRGFMRPI